VQLEQLELRAQLLALLVQQVLLVLPVQLVQLEPQELLVQQERQVQRVHKEYKELRVQQGLLVHKALQDQLDTLDQLDTPVIPDQQVRLVLHLQ
jgi:hypothetical protein